MEATKQTKMTKEDLHLSWKDKLNIIRDNRYFLMLFPIVMLAVMILIFGVATAGRFFKLSVMKGILSQAIIIGTCATALPLSTPTATWISPSVRCLALPPHWALRLIA